MCWEWIDAELRWKWSLRFRWFKRCPCRWCVTRFSQKEIRIYVQDIWSWRVIFSLFRILECNISAVEYSTVHSYWFSLNNFRDGFISNEELFTVLKMMTGDNLTDVQLQQIVNRTILYLDQNSDGKIGMQEFIKGKIRRYNDFKLAIFDVHEVIRHWTNEILHLFSSYRWSWYRGGDLVNTSG